MTSKPLQPSEKPPRSGTPSYHHGRLAEALIEATVELVETQGPERWTMREAARKAGVSSGAPFRHFPNKTALLTAVAVQAMERLSAAVQATVRRTESEPPLERFRAVGRTYLDWVLANPTHFKVLSDRASIDWSRELQSLTAEVQSLMRQPLEAAQRAGDLRPIAIDAVLLDARALSYGMARMAVDGQLATWGVSPGDEARAITASFDRFVDNLFA